MENEKTFRRRLAAAESMAVRSRNYRRARERALTALARAYKDQYLALLEEEKKKDEQKGKRWNNLSHNLSNSGDNITHNSVSKARGDTSDIPQDESDNE